MTSVTKMGPSPIVNDALGALSPEQRERRNKEVRSKLTREMKHREEDRYDHFRSAQVKAVDEQIDTLKDTAKWKSRGSNVEVAFMIANMALHMIAPLIINIGISRGSSWSEGCGNPNGQYLTPVESEARAKLTTLWANWLTQGGAGMKGYCDIAQYTNEASKVKWEVYARLHETDANFHRQREQEIQQNKQSDDQNEQGRLERENAFYAELARLARGS